MVPAERIELPTFGLQNRCSTAELSRLPPRCLATKSPPINEGFGQLDVNFSRKPIEAESTDVSGTGGFSITSLVK
jgi:hypothetical protein